MSRKIQNFINIITTPLNIHNFEVSIPGFDYPFIVQSTTFPTETMRTVVLYTFGEEVRYPTIPQNSGNWRIQVPDNDNGDIREALDAFKNRRWDQLSGIMDGSSIDWDDIVVKARDLNNQVVFQSTLVGAWLQGREEVQLNNSDPTQAWKWDYTFRYQYIIDK